MVDGIWVMLHVGGGWGSGQVRVCMASGFGDGSFGMVSGLLLTMGRRGCGMVIGPKVVGGIHGVLCLHSEQVYTKALCPGRNRSGFQSFIVQTLCVVLCAWRDYLRQVRVGMWSGLRSLLRGLEG
jgi:hypothetical protein